jgi:hypothetical protein
MLLGHEEVVEALSYQLPPVAVITGPSSVGKRLIAVQAAITHDVHRLDFLEIKKLSTLSAELIQDFVETKPYGNFKCCLIDLDAASIQSTHKLLKVLEEPPNYAKFVLVSSKRLPKPILTRSQRYTVGLLRPTDLQKILLSKGISEVDSKKLSHLGRVDIALESYKKSVSVSIAISILDAVLSGDYILFLQAYKAADDTVADTIISILQESASQRWKMYSPDSLGDFSKKEVAIKVLNVWSNLSIARPVLAVKVTLESLMKGY